MDGKTCWFADEQNQIVTDGRNSWSLEVEDLREELSRRMSMVEDLEAWKEKARPFLVNSLERLTSCFLERTDEDNIRHDGIRESYKSKIKTLTELLGDK